MGADVARAAGLSVAETGAPVGARTTAQDTRAAAVEMARAGVELLLFAGGDGTARDIVDVVGSELPLVGVPAGVKIARACSPRHRMRRAGRRARISAAA